MKIGYVGLGKMGANMVLRLLEKNIEVVAWNRSPEPLDKVVSAGAQAANSLENLANQLDGKKIIWLMLPAGEVTDTAIKTLLPYLNAGDLIIDGANSFYKDTLRRAEELSQHQIKLLDIGVSGGPDGARSGACLMIGGYQEDLTDIHELIEAIAAPNAYGYFGKIGSGHFAKMAHNGIEYGMMEAIAEGVAILKESNFDFDLANVLRVYNNQSVVSSRLVGWTKEALQEDQELTNTNSKIGALGEGHWTAKVAKELGVSIPVIDAALDVRDNSEQVEKDTPNEFRNKVVSAQRGKFGKHPVKIKAEV